MFAFVFGKLIFFQLCVSPPPVYSFFFELYLDSRVLRRSRFAAGLRAHAAVDPVFRLQGPLPPPLIPIVLLTRHSHMLGNGRRHYG